MLARYRPHWRACFVWLLIPLVGAPGVAARVVRDFAEPPAPVVLVDGQGEYPLGRALEVLEDPAKQWTIDEVAGPEFEARFTPSRADTPSFGYTGSAYWLRFRVRNDTSATSDWRLDLDDARVGLVDLYLPAADGAGYDVPKRAGRFLPFDSREIAQHQYVFKVPLAPHAEQTIYLRVESDAALVVPLTLWTPNALALDSQTDYLLAGLCYGVLLVIVGYQLFVSFTLPDRSYLYSALAVASFTLNQAARDGFAHQYLWPAWPNGYGIALFGVLAGVCALQFASVFLDVARRAPRLQRVMQVDMLAGGGLLLLTPFTRTLPLLSVWLIFSVLVIIGAGWQAWRRGYSPARYYLASWCVILIGMALYILAAFGLLPGAFIVENASLPEVALFSLLGLFALSARIRLLRTETTRIDEALLESEERYRRVVELLPDALYTADDNGVVTFANPSAVRLFGAQRPEELLGHSLFEFVPQPEQKALLLERRSQLRANQISAPHEYTDTVGLDGVRRSAEVVTTLFAHHGKSEWLTVARDTTERNRMAAELRRAYAELEARSQTLEHKVVERTAELSAQRQHSERVARQQTILNAVIRAVSQQLAPAATLQEAVSAIARFAGWPHAALALATPDGAHWRVAAYTGSTSGAAGSEFPMPRGMIGRALATAQPQWAPDVRADPDRLVLFPEARSQMAVPLVRGAQVLGALDLESDQPAAFTPDDVILARSLADAVALALENAQLFEATQRQLAALRAAEQSLRESEARFRTLAEQIPAVTYIDQPDATGTSLYISPQVEALLGYPLAEWTRDPEFWHSIVHPGDYALAVEFIAATLREGRAAAEYRLIARDGHVVWIRDEAVLIRDEDGRPRWVQGILIDIDERKQLERMREDLIEMVIHDLRAPTSTATMTLDLLLDPAREVLTPEQQNEWLRNARRAAGRILELVNTLLDVSQLESGQMPLQREPVVLEHLAAEACQAQAPLAGQKDLQLVNAAPAALPRAWVDPRLIGRVLQNLINNAIKFTPAGGAIRVEAAVEGAEPPMLRVSVQDSGPGIPAEIQSRLFQKFARGQQPGHGSGLGLAFCRLVVEAHGGRIWAESEPGQGSTFSFTVSMFDEARAMP
jgi:PAS domain S-box-containing protein